MICKYKNCNNKTEPIKNWGTKYKLYCSRDCRYLEYNRDNRYSAGNRLQKNKKYLSRYPTLVKEFNYELNDFLPKDISYGSAKLVWWTCSEGHNYESSANTRTNMRAGCPYCSGNKVGYGNDLESMFPEIASEWDYDKNEDNPSDITYGSKQRRYFVCKNKHSYLCPISYRTGPRKAQCPTCLYGDADVPTSRIEKMISDVLKAEPNVKIGKYKVDMLLGNTIIEYDGSYWHRNSYEADLRKTKYLQDLGYKVIRVREIHGNRIPKYVLKDVKGCKNIRHKTNYKKREEEAQIIADKILQKI
tara:strand:- start:10 stop:915 length:906 start_codon:yes stop_codon:yes gene_type:complete